VNCEKLKAKGILIDLDGTIVDSRQAYLEAVKTALSAVGKKTVDISVVTEIPKRIEQNLPINDLLEGADTTKFLETYFKAWYQASSLKAKPMPKIGETLNKLAQKAKLAVITMRHVPRMDIIKQLERFGVAKYFQIVVTGMDVERQKPSPEGLLKCAEELHVREGECIVVGDSVLDVRLGKGVGARTVAVLSGIYSLDELKNEKPDLILEDLSKLANCIE
jgi:phosphoglycolate phosphatase